MWNNFYPLANLAVGNKQNCYDQRVQHFSKDFSRVYGLIDATKYPAWSK